ncbi:MAG: hypothetical protein ACI9SC_002662, partial [Gammaproteobacteria bacterium]
VRNQMLNETIVQLDSRQKHAGMTDLIPAKNMRE